jgi:RNA polymerase sigma-70 factor (ECF subfamily)
VDEDKARWVRDCLERFEAPLLAYASRLLGDRHAAEDAVQEAFLRLCASDRGTVAARIPGWLYAVTRNLALDRRRRARVMERTNAATLDGRPGAAEDPADRAAAGDSAAAALRALAALPDKQQEALLLRLRHGLSYREIAEVMDVTVDHVGVLLHEGLKALRKRLGVAVTAAVPAAAAAPVAREAAR